MRAVLVSVFLVLGFAGRAEAQGTPSPAPTEDHGRIEGVTVDPARIPPQELRLPVIDPERGTRKPSGYWTGYRPAQGGAYKWPLVAVGAFVTLITASILIVGLRRVSRNRPARPGLRAA
jgi:hypothetical protein